MEQKPKEFALEYAGFWIRLGAGIVDFLTLYVLYGIILGLIIWVSACALSAAGQGSVAGAASSVGDDASIYRLITLPIVWVVAWLIKIAYFAGFWVWRGQTPGKMAMGIKVIRTDSSPLTLQYALLRYLGYIVSAIILFVGFIWIALDSRKQGIHDKIADTYVVKLPVRQVVLTESFARGGAG